MVSSEYQLPICPECKRSDQVKTTRAAYNYGVALAAPPDVPTKKVLMLPYLSTCILLIGIFVFLIIVSLGGMDNNLPAAFLWPLFVLALLSIISALVVSYMAFQRVVRGDNEAALHFAAYDRAMNTWSHLYYCSRDKVVFEPEAEKALSKEEITELQTVTGYQWA
jgi:hypothetical protein